MSKKEAFCSGEAPFSFVYGREKKKKARKTDRKRVLPCPHGELFKVHGSKFKRDPSGNPGQASMMCIPHRVFFFRIGKDALNGLLTHGIQVFTQLGFTQLLRQIHGLLPDMPLHHLLPFGTGSALLPAGTVPADLRGTAVNPFAVFAGGGVPEHLPLWAVKTVVCFLIGKIPGHISLSSYTVRTGVRKNRNSVVL